MLLSIWIWDLYRYLLHTSVSLLRPRAPVDQRVMRGQTNGARVKSPQPLREKKGPQKYKKKLQVGSFLHVLKPTIHQGCGMKETFILNAQATNFVDFFAPGKIGQTQSRS